MTSLPHAKGVISKIHYITTISILGLGLVSIDATHRLRPRLVIVSPFADVVALTAHKPDAVMQTLTPTRQSSDEAMAQYLLLRELQLKEQVEALARLPEVATMQSNCQADDMTVNVFDVLEDDFFDEIPLQAPGSPCRSESSMASSTNTACLEGAVPSLPLVVDDAHGAHDSETGVTHWLNAAFTCAAACSSRTLTTSVPAHLLDVCSRLAFTSISGGSPRQSRTWSCRPRRAGRSTCSCRSAGTRGGGRTGRRRRQRRPLRTRGCSSSQSPATSSNARHAWRRSGCAAHQRPCHRPTRSSHATWIYMAPEPGGADARVAPGTAAHTLRGSYFIAWYLALVRCSQSSRVYFRCILA